MKLIIKKIMRPVLLVTLVFLSIEIYAQTPQLSIMQSPNASSLGMFGTIPVSLYTGVPDISVPIHTISYGNINIPISLQYHPGNVKPNKYPGWVGLGWNLSCHGVISRRINGTIDENDYNASSYKPYYKGGSKLLDAWDWDSEKKLKRYFSAGSDDPDVRADEFFFNFLGYSGKFMYTPDGWVVISDHNIKVAFDDHTGFIYNKSLSYYCGDEFIGINGLDMQSRMFKSFTLITDDGTKYIFGGEDAIEYITPYVNKITAWYANAWYLKKIIDADNNMIEFAYHRGFPICEKAFVSSNFFSSCDVLNDWNDWSEVSFHTSAVDNTQHSGYLTLPVYLSSIKWESGEAVFMTSPSVQKTYAPTYLKYSFFESEINNIPVELKNLSYSGIDSQTRGFQWKQLDGIQITNKMNTIKDFRFNYSDSPSERLTLHSIEETGAGKYDFFYNKIPDLSEYGGNYTDHWGYYNGTNVKWTTFASLPSNKATNPKVATLGLLEKMVYPTKGYTEFEWEANQYGQIVSADRQSVKSATGYAGGARIKKIQHIPLSGESQIKRYSYNSGVSTVSSGILNGLPQYRYVLTKRKISDDPYAEMEIYEHQFVSGMFSYSYNAMGSHIGYSEVTETNEDDSYTKYYFTNYSKDIHGQSHFDQKAKTLGWLQGDDVYIPSTSLESERGKLLMQEAYNNKKILLKKTQWAYTTDPLRFNLFVPRVSFDARISCGPYELILAAAYKEYTYRYLPLSKKTTIYDANGKNGVTESEEYAYNSLDQLSQIKTIGSNGLIQAKEYVYPVNVFSGPDLSVIKKMTQRHILSPYIEVLDYVINDNQKDVYQVTYHKYAEFGKEIIKPYQVKTLRTGTMTYDKLYPNVSQNVSLSVERTTSSTEKEFTVGQDGYTKLSMVLDVETKKSLEFFDFSFKINGPESLLWDLRSLKGGTVTDNGEYLHLNYNESFYLPPGNYTASLIYHGTVDEFYNGICNVGFTERTKSTAGRSEMETRLQFDYNEQGKMVELLTAESTSTVYLWAYNHQYPIAKIENALHSSVAHVLGTTPEAVAVKDVPSEADFEKVNNLRKLLPAAMVTTYTYNPLVGMTSETDPSGKTIFYEYDASGRLWLVKDHDGNITKDYQYNYKQ